MTCDNCLYCNICYSRIKFGKGFDIYGHPEEHIEETCTDFKNKDNFIELPCVEGTTVYKICSSTDSVKRYYIKCITFNTKEEIVLSLNLFGDTIFFNSDDAVNKLKILNKE